MTTWGVQLTTLENRASEHDKFGTQLITNLAEPLKVLAARYEDLRKSHSDYAAKLEKERDGSYSDLRKLKGKYDSSCQEVENRRRKTDSAFDMSKQKAAVAYQQQTSEMRNVKNTYLININVTNKQKSRYYHEYVPELIDSMQDLSETRISKLNQIWSTAALIETQTLQRSTEYLTHLAGEIPRNNPTLDSMMFVRHNVGSFQEPGDFTFEPSPVWLDDNGMAVDEAAKNFLRNILLKSKGSLAETRRELDQKRKDVANARAARQAIRDGRDKRDEVECVRAIFHIQEQMHEVEARKTTAEVEVLTITAAVGDVSIGAKNHNFKSETFKIPTNCDLCGDRIWGLSAKGFSCRDCGYTCHSKCQMKVPADCPGEIGGKDERKKLKNERQEAAHTANPPTNGAAADSHQDNLALRPVSTADSMNTLSSGYSATAQRSISGAAVPTTTSAFGDENEVPGPIVPAKPMAAAPGSVRKNRVMAPPPMSYVSSNGDGGGGDGVGLSMASPTSSQRQQGRMMYAYQKNGEGEISVEDGKDVTVLEPDGESAPFLSSTPSVLFPLAEGSMKQPCQHQLLCCMTVYRRVSITEEKHREHHQ